MSPRGEPLVVAQQPADQSTRRASSSTHAPLVQLENLSFAYDTRKPILQDIHWQLYPGESWGILGPSGCGKTTLLHLIAGIRRPTAGRVCYRGEPILKPNHAIGLMLQDYGLLPWYTAERNIQIGLEIRGLSAREIGQRTDDWLDTLGITAIRHQYPNRVSGGQRQRIALARLLALQTPVRLLDEPLSAVDELTRERLQAQLWRLNQSTTAVTVMVTHNIEEAVLLNDHLMVITQHSPVRSYETLRVPFADTLPKRSDPQFIAFCQQIREMVGI